MLALSKWSMVTHIRIRICVQTQAFTYCLYAFLVNETFPVLSPLRKVVWPHKPSNWVEKLPILAHSAIHCCKWVNMRRCFNDERASFHTLETVSNCHGKFARISPAVQRLVVGLLRLVVQKSTTTILCRGDVHALRRTKAQTNGRH